MLRNKKLSLKNYFAQQSSYEGAMGHSRALPLHFFQKLKNPLLSEIVHILPVPFFKILIYLPKKQHASAESSATYLSGN